VSTAVAVVLLLAVVAYAVFGGADFGAGFWDLTAGGPQRGERPRGVIEHSIGPVWEANHVWLIFIFVILWTSFPEAYASITLTLFVPLTIAALGIVLRGAIFAFRKGCRRYALSPCFGGRVCRFLGAGALLQGSHCRRHRLRTSTGWGPGWDPVQSWINPTSVLGGVLAVAAAAYLAAVYLVWDARRLDEEMAEYFRRRAVAAAAGVGVIGLVGIFVLAGDASYLFDGLTSRVSPLVILSALCGLGALVLLVRNSQGRPAARRHCRRKRRRRLGRGPVALPVAGEPDLLGCGGSGRHAGGCVGCGSARGRNRFARVRTALCPSSEGTSSGGRCGRSAGCRARVTRRADISLNRILMNRR
jgi:cytochrome bd ubiquinol oxidase subunit II